MRLRDPSPPVNLVSPFTEGKLLVTTPTISPVTYPLIGTAPQQIVRSNSGAVNIYNGDLVNVLLVSPSNNPALTNSVPIQPLTNASIDGTQAQYAAALTGTCSSVTVGNALQMSPSPAQVAAQITASGLALAIAQQVALGGVPLLTSSSSLVTANAVACLAGVPVTLPGGPFVIKQTGYEVSLDISLGAGTPPGPLTVDFLWTDSVSGNGVRRERHDIWPSTIVHGHIIAGLGPTKGDRLTVVLNNAVGAQTINASIIILQNSRIPARDDWRTISGIGTASGITVGGGDITKKNLLIANQSVGIASTTSRQFPYYNGICDVQFNTASATSDAAITIRDAGLTEIRQVFTDSKGNAEFRLTLPNSECSCDLTNQNAAAKVLAVYVTIADY